MVLYAQIIIVTHSTVQGVIDSSSVFFLKKGSDYYHVCLKYITSSVDQRWTWHLGEIHLHDTKLAYQVLHSTAMKQAHVQIPLLLNGIPMLCE